MAGERDSAGVPHHVVSAELAERLLGAGDDIDAHDPVTDPAGMAAVADLVAALRAPETAGERMEAAHAAAAFAVLARSGPVSSSSTTHDRTSAMEFPTQRSHSKAVAAIATAFVLSVGSAAAATGSLPDTAQRGVAHVLAFFGIDVPFPQDRPPSAVGAPVPSTTTSLAVVLLDGGSDETTTTPPTTTPATTTTLAAIEPSTTVAERAARVASSPPVGPVPTAPSKDGLCTAYAASRAATGPNGDSVAMQAVAAAAAGAGQTVEQFCGLEPIVAAAITPAPPESSTTAPAQPSATAPGHSDESPGATAPGRDRGNDDSEDESGDDDESDDESGEGGDGDGDGDGDGERGNGRDKERRRDSGD
jgi:hypothetical protein